MIITIILLNLLNLFFPQIKIENAWLRPANKGMNTALYFDINNLASKDYELTEVSSEIAKVVQIHETYKQGENMGMRKVESIIIKGKTVFHLSPGGFHVMIIRLKENLRAGDKKEFVLSFKNHAKMRIIVFVKDE
jgi:periplasmic copper chaperone A